MLRIAMVAAEVARPPHIVALAEALTSAGHEVTVLAGDGDVTAAARECRADVVHAFGRHEAARAAATTLDVPLVLRAPSDTLPIDTVPRDVDHVLAAFSGQQKQLIAA